MSIYIINWENDVNNSEHLVSFPSLLLVLQFIFGFLLLCIGNVSTPDITDKIIPTKILFILLFLFQDAADLSVLYCYYSNTTIPYYKGKVEVVNLHPKIVLFHDVLSEAEISYLRSEGRDKVIYDHNLAPIKEYLMFVTKDQF